MGKKTIFISYASQDRDFVQKLAEKIKKDFGEDVEIWIDYLKINVGNSITEKINEGLKESSFFIIVFSKYSLESEWVKRELNAALMKQLNEKDIKILPILLEIDPRELPPLFLDICCAKFSSREFIDEKEYEKLIEPIKDKKSESLLINFQSIFLENIQHIDIILPKKFPSREEIDFMLKLIKKEKEYENYFFNNLSNHIWLDILKKEEFFNPDKVSRPLEREKGYFSIPFWPPLLYLEKISQQIKDFSKEEKQKYTKELLEIIKNITEYHINNNKILDNYHVWSSFIRILANLPLEEISEEIINLIKYWLDSKFDNSLQTIEILEKLLPKFLESDNYEDLKKAEKIIEILTEIKWVPKYSEGYKKKIKEKYKEIFEKSEEQRIEEEKLLIAMFDLDAQIPSILGNMYFVHNFLIIKRYGKKIGEKCSKRIIYTLADRLKEIFTKKYHEKYYDGSNFWIPSLSDDSFSEYNEGERLLTLIIRDILLGKSEKDRETTKKILKEFLTDKYPYPLFKRLVLFIISKKWEEYRDIFWQIVKETDLFNNIYYQLEVYEILKNNVSKFSKEEKEIIKEVIEEKVPEKPHPEEKYKEIYAAYQKQKWYSALKSDPFFTYLYEEYKKITNKDVSYVEISPVRIEVKSGSGPSPLRKEEILEMENEKLAEYLKNFKTIDWWNGPTVRGLAIELENAVKINPDKFINNLSPFLKVGYLYITYLLSGIEKALRDKKIIDWEKLLNFIYEYIKQEDFWKDKFTVEDHYPMIHKEVIKTIGSLIEEGISGDLSFPEKCIFITKEILFFILEHLEKDFKEKEEEITDFVFYALNTPLGRIIRALISLILMIKRIEKETQKEYSLTWENDFKPKYEELIKSEIIESYVWLGYYLPYFFYYLDKKWVKEKIDQINLNKKKIWEAFVCGYLFSSPIDEPIYKFIYKLMRSHYINALDYEFRDTKTKRDLVKHISIAYMYFEKENMDNEESLFRKLLDKWDYFQIEEIINFFWRKEKEIIEQEPNKYEEIRKKVIKFWGWIYESKYKNKKDLNEDDKKILSNLLKLTVFLSEIDNENKEWLKLSAKYASSTNFEILITRLDALKSKDNVKYIGEILVKMLKEKEKENYLPDWSREKIISVVEYLFQNEDSKKEAREICDIYARKGHLFLKDIYYKYT